MTYPRDRGREDEVNAAIARDYPDDAAALAEEAFAAQAEAVALGIQEFYEGGVAPLPDGVVKEEGWGQAPKGLAGVEFNAKLLRAQMEVVRVGRNMTWRQIGYELGVSASAFTRLKYGQPPCAGILLRLMLWVGETDVEQYVVKEES